ncbi:MAG: AtpZ/AtpI family protein [Chloroflexi bacterium]|nr:AtpZ/AtpI family protein [Chloroflexota bacterium]
MPHRSGYEPDEERKTTERKRWPYLAEFMQLGWVVAFSLLAPLALGVWLDQRLGTAPVFILISMLVGTLAATVGAVRMASRMMAQIAPPKEPAAEPPSPESEEGTGSHGADRP